MDMPRNQFKQAIAAGRTQIGLWSSLCSSYAAEAVAGCGFDWVLLDSEHAPNDVPDLMAQLQAMQGSPTAPVVRVPWNDPVMVKRVLDIGAQSVLFPFVQNVAEAKRAVAATRFPPAGIRGVAGTTRATKFGRIAGYHHKADAEMCVLVQVETKTALDNLEAIAAVDGVDGVFIGPADLAASLGHLGNFAHPDVQAAISDAMKRLKAAGKPGGYLTPNEEEVRRRLAEGFTFVAVGSDIALLARGGEALAKKFKS
ncbi:MAG: 4-hydroxy-2-oxo-heptane-1,7-dioate aldolase [Rhodospirillales bacterium]|nr:4-hydroxy-2-oxo-heptane-1,7-dioate aldolase [Rhodospirillales bacterium]